MGLTSQIRGRLRDISIDLARGGLRLVQHAAARHGITNVLGVNELDSRFSGTTLFNPMVTIGPNGSVRNQHHKLLPSNSERMVWGMGDAAGRRVVATQMGWIGATRPNGPMAAMPSWPALRRLLPAGH